MAHVSGRSGLPVVEELPGGVEAEQAFLRLAGLPHRLFLDSAMRDPHLGRFSFLSADPFEFLSFPPTVDALGPLERRLAELPAENSPDLPPFQGGAAGLIGYDLGRQLEILPEPRYDEFAVPALAVGFYDVVVAFDHLADRAWIISQGLPEREPNRRKRRAARRLDEFRRRILQGAGAPLPPAHPAPESVPRKLAAEQLAPQTALGPLPGLTSNFTRQGYLAAVARVVEYIRNGDVFQVNLAQRLLHPADDDSASLYLRLRRRNPAPFAGFFDLGSIQIASASPERFLRVDDGWVETRPIKGTRPRSGDRRADEAAARGLLASGKDRSENVMIVDLMRNDLSKVCRADSVTVRDLCVLERYEFVQHLVSTVCGRLCDGAGCVEVIRAAFPGGSITGAPKVRAMEIIAELEPTARGAYCGSLGYLGFDGSMDLNILIRTVTAARGWWQAPVGGGIVAQSVPEVEYEETWQKAEGILRSFPP